MKPEPGRVRRMTQGRVASVAVLAVVGVSAGLIAIFGDLLSRVVAVAALLAGAVLACLLVWLDNRRAERQRAAAELGQAILHGEQLRTERLRQRAVLHTLAAQMQRLRERLGEAELRSCQLRQELSTARGNNEALRVELELQAALTAPSSLGIAPQWQEPPDPWVTARELWRISDEAELKRSA